MGCGDEKLSKYWTQTFTAHCNAMICQQVTLLGDAGWPKVADAVIEAIKGFGIAADVAASAVAARGQWATNYSLAAYVTESLAVGLTPEDLSALISTWAW